MEAVQAWLEATQIFCREHAGAGLVDACGKSRSQEEASPSVPLKASWGRLGPYGEVYLAAGEFGLNAGRRPERPSGSDFL